MSRDEVVAFVEARLDEDEAVALAATRGPWGVGHTDELVGPDGPWNHPPGTVVSTSEGRWPQRVRVEGTHVYSRADLGNVAELSSRRAEDAAHIARHDPAAVLERVAAQRRVVNLYVRSAERDATMRAMGGGAPLALATAAYWECVWALAGGWSEHPDFDQEWRR